MFLRHKTVKHVFQNGLNEKIYPMFNDHPFACLGLFKAISIVLLVKRNTLILYLYFHRALILYLYFHRLSSYL